MGRGRWKGAPTTRSRGWNSSQKSNTESKIQSLIGKPGEGGGGVVKHRVVLFVRSV
jgi:hypothetical protein